MEEKIIFEQFVGKWDQSDSIFIRLSSLSDTQLFQFRIGSITIKEGLSMGTPIVAIDFIDASGDLVNHNRLDTSGIYKLHIGRSLDRAKVMNMKISKILYQNHVGGKSEQFNFRVMMVHESWNEMMHQSHNRGWANTRISDVANTIGSSMGFSPSVSRTNQIMETIVQPHWTNLTMLKWLAERADTTTAEKGHFEFGVTIGGNFFFKSIPDLIRESIRNYIPTLKLGGYNINPKHHADDLKANEYIPTSFLRFGATEDIMDTVIQGAGGVSGMYYDFNTGQYMRQEHTFGNSNNIQLSDWSMLHYENEKASLNLHHGRDTNSAAISNNRVSAANASIQRLRLECQGTPELEIGKLVEVLIPTPVDKSNVPYNEMYSGFYLISEVEHRITPRSRASDFSSTITVSRQGVDGKSLKGLVRSNAGRANFNA